MAEGGNDKAITQNYFFINLSRTKSVTNFNANKIGQVMLGANQDQVFENPEEKQQVVVEENQPQDGVVRNFHDNAEPADRLIAESKFEEAISLLEGSSETQSQQLMLTECYFQLNNNNKAMRSFGKLETMMTSSPRPKVDDVMKTIYSYIDKSSYIRALILLSCASKLYKIYSNPNDAIRGVEKCSRVCSFKVIKRMVEHGEKKLTIAKDFGIEIHVEMLSDLRKITGAHNALEGKIEALCLSHIASSYRYIGEYSKAIEHYHQAIDLMQRKFGLDAAKYAAFGAMLNNTAMTYELLGNYVEAEKFFKKSVESYNKAQDWGSDNNKQEEIGIAVENLKIIRETLDQS